MILNPLEQFQIVPLIDLYIGTFDISFNNSALIAILAVIFFLTLVNLILTNGSGLLIPTRWQTFIEFIYNFISDTLSENVGPKGAGFFPFLFILFVFILFANLIGMVPYSFTITSHIVVTLFFALIVYLACTFLLFREHGYHGMSLFLPSGSPLPLMPILIIIEVISNVMRVISLSVRLFANMMSGHILLKVLLGFAWKMLLSGGFLFILHFAPLGIVFVLLFLETGVAIIQAYVFVALTCIYLNESLNLH